MHISHVTITVPDPAETAQYLASIFDLPLEMETDGPTLTIGASRLTMLGGPTEPDGYYHLAFEIPENKVFEARDQLAARVPILDGGDNGIVTGAPAWNSHSVYFNAPGNLNLELIGRHRLPNALARPFALSDVLRISEAGVAVDDPLAASHELREQTGLEPFGEPAETFAPMGNDDGLLILVKQGRIWYPTNDQSTTQRPLRIEIDGIDGQLDLGPSCTIVGLGKASVTT